MKKKTQNRFIAVLTGDIINSRDAENLKEVISEMKQFFCEYGEENEMWEFFRGDSFQLQLQDISEALRVALIIKSLLKQHKGLDVRIAIGIGTVDIESADISERNGTAFVRSGKCFDEIGKLTLQMKSPWKELDSEMNLHYEVSGLLSDDWTPHSAEYVYLSLRNVSSTQAEIAKMLGIGQGRVSDRNKRAALDEILKINERYKYLINQQLEETK